MNLDQRYRFFFLFFLVSFLVTGFISLGQIVYTKNFTIDDGLPSNIVRAIFKDSRGIMWIGTGAGLCRFNGREFKVYNSADGLTAENIFDITEDDQGNIWIGAMAEGISKFDGIRFTNYTTKNGLVCNDVRRVWWSKKFNILMVGTNKGCSVYDGRRFYSLNPAEAKSPSETYYVLGFLEKNDCIELYAYGYNNVCRYYPASHKFINSEVTRFSAGGFSCSPVLGKNGDTVSGWGRNGVKVWNNGLRASFDSLGQVFHMVVDESKNVWIAAWAELYEKSMSPGGFFMYDGNKIVNMGKKTGISDPGIWTVYYDTVFHVVWVGTLHQGLYRMPFPYFEWHDASGFGLSSMKLNEIYNDKQNNLWIATSRGVIRKIPDKGFYIYPDREIKKMQYDVFLKFFPLYYSTLCDKNGSFEKYEQLIAAKKYPYPNPYLLLDADIGSVKKTPDGSLYNPQNYTDIFIQRKKMLLDTTANSYYSIAEDSRHNIYISGGWGLTRFKAGSNLKPSDVIPVYQANYLLSFDEADTLFGSSYWDLGIWHATIFPEMMFPRNYYSFSNGENAPDRPIRMISRGNEIWCASRTGGLYLTLDGKNYAFSKADTSLPQSINDICFDGKQNIIAGANNGQLVILKLEGDKLKILYRLNGKEGIAGNSIRWVQTDKRRQLYIGTNTGLNIIDLNTLFETGKTEVRFFSRETGYFDLSGKRAVVDSAGDIWIATDRNLCRIDHELIHYKPAHKAQMVLAGMEINNTPLSKVGDYPEDIWFGSPTKAVKLSHDQNNLVFYFDALNYLDANQQQFRYRLLPIIKTWSEFSTDRKAVFTTLGSGKYTFEVESLNPMDKNQISRLTYRFTIVPPLYFRWWFILLLLMLLAGISFFILRLRFNLIRTQEKQKADARIELNNIEMKALKAQMNPHFIFNAINSIQSYILSSNIDKALFYLSMFAKLVRKTLENATKEIIPLCEELDYLHYYIELEKMRFEGQFTAAIEIDPDLPLETTMIPPMIVQPFIENAIKHGLLKLNGDAVLKVEVKKINEQQYQVIIEDNGIGRKRAEELKKSEGRNHVSKGMEITNTRIRLLNSNGNTGMFNISFFDLTNPDGSARGTRVEVTCPLDI